MNIAYKYTNSKHSMLLYPFAYFKVHCIFGETGGDLEKHIDIGSFVEYFKIHDVF